jgi:hypothetical protein
MSLCENAMKTFLCSRNRLTCFERYDGTDIQSAKLCISARSSRETINMFRHFRYDGTDIQTAQSACLQCLLRYLEVCSVSCFTDMCSFYCDTCCLGKASRFGDELLTKLQAYHTCNIGLSGLQHRVF